MGERVGRLVLAAVLVLTLGSTGATTIHAAQVSTENQSGPAPFVPPGLVEVERGGRSLNEIAAGFPAPTEAAALLATWGWAANAFYNYQGETAAGTTSLEVSFHLFADDASATEAMSYFAAGRALILGMDPVPVGRIGDEVLAIGGRRDGVNETTLYLRKGALLVRVSAVAPRGDPTGDAIATADALIGGATVGNARVPARSYEDLLPAAWELPAGFAVADEGYRSASEIAETFLRPREAANVLANAGFQENVYRSFAVPSGRSAYPGAATRVEVSLHLFTSAGGAADALPYYADGRSEAIGLRIAGYYEIGGGTYVLQGVAPGGGIEVTAYVLYGNVLARISAVSPDGDPTADVLAVALLMAGRV